MPTTAVKLPAILEKFVASQVREGTYRSREAAIVAAVSHQKRRSEQLAWLQSEIQRGLDSGPAGELDIEKVIRRVVVGLPLEPAGLGADAASNRTLFSRSACRLRCHLRLHRTRQSTRSGSSAALARSVDPTARGSAKTGKGGRRNIPDILDEL
jgi:putative addiction module CopG family antidote